MTKVFISSVDKVELDNIKFNKLYKTGTGIIKNVITYNNQTLHITGTKMVLGSDVVKNGDYYYIDLIFNSKIKSNIELLKFIKDIDNISIAEILENPKLWYPKSNGDISLLQIEQEYIPTIKSCMVFTSNQSLKLKIPIDKIEFFDQDNINIPYQLIKENYKVVPLLSLSGLYKDNSYIWTMWDLPQMKVILPETMLQGCHLVDIDESDEETIPEKEYINDHDSLCEDEK